MAADLMDLALRLNIALAAAIVFVAAARKPLRRLAGARVAYALWLVPPLAAAASLVPASSVPEPLLIPLPAEAFVVFAEPAPPAASAPLDAMAMVLALWAVGTIASLGWFGLRHAAFLRRAGRLVRRDDGALQSRTDVGPAVLGVVAPRIVLPADFDRRFSPGEQAVVLAHEQSHLRAGDAQINALLVLCQCLFWFNPLVHLAARLIREDQELACDAAVVARYPEARRAYAEAMLKTQLAAAPSPLGCYWPARGGHPLKERLAMLKRNAPGRARRLLGGAAALGAGLGAAYAAWAAHPTRTLIEEAPAVAAAFDRLDLSLDVQRPAPPDPPAPRAPASPPPAAPRVLIRPEWLQAPAASEVGRAYPEEALRQERQGSAVINCTVAADGTLQNCVIAAENPTGWGFGRGALQLAPLFRMRPTDAAGVSVAGARVNIPIDFRLDPQPSRPVPPPPPDITPPPPTPLPPTPLMRNPLYYPDPPLPALPPARPSVITQPQWIRRPTAEDLTAHYPARALREERQGTAILNCTVTETGTLTACWVAAENPTGWGFGQAALGLVPHFQMSPRTRDGAPVGGARVNIPVEFRLAPPPAPPNPPAG